MKRPTTAEEAEELTAKAKAEHDAGRRRFGARIRFWPKEDSEAWARAVEAIEDVGWVVDHFAVASLYNTSPDYGYFLFKRR